MKRGILIITMLLTACLPSMARHDRDTLGAGTMIRFVENLGQWDSHIRFEAQLHDAALFLEDDGLTVTLRAQQGHPSQTPSPIRYHAYKMHFSEARPTMPTGLDRQPGFNNYFIGDDPSRWRSRVGSYVAARYSDLYPGVDLEIYGGAKALKYNFIVAPGADATKVVMEYEGPEEVSVGRDGNLIVRTSVKDVVEMRPYVYQRIGGKEGEVKCRWRVEKGTKKLEPEDKTWKVWIEIGDYNHDEELVIDPVLIFSTYTGSTADNWGTTAAYDSEKNVYTAGLVFNIGYPVSMGAYQPSFGGNCDVGIFKFDSSGTQRLYATYLGGAQADMPHSLFVNSFDELVVFGSTGSTNFPVTAGAVQPNHAGGSSLSYEDPYDAHTIYFPQGSDIFISRLSSDGTQLHASTYIGGSGNDGLNYHQRYNSSTQIIMAGNDSLYYNYGDGARGELIIDNLNNVYVGSTTMSADFPTTAGALLPSPLGRQDGVVFKLDHNLHTLLWSTYLGGNMDDAVYSIDVDSSYNLLVCGGTNSSNFPTTEGAWQRSYGGGSADGFVSKISYNGDRLMASTFVGNNSYDQIYFVRTGRRNEVFLFGQTKPIGSSSFIYNASYSVYNSGMLLMRMLPDLSNRVWSTLFGTPGRINLSPTAFAADICNRVYAVGWGRDFVGYNGVQWYTAGTTGMETSSDAWSDSTDGQDFYILSIDENAANLDYATFFGELHQSGSSRGGGDHVDGGTSRFDKLATLYQSVCASCGGFDGFPTTAGAWSDSNRANNCNNALFRFNVTDDYPVAEFVSPTAGCAPYTVNFRNTGRGSSFLWDFGDGSTSTQRDPTHTYNDGGIYTVTLIATMPGGCSEADTQRHTLHVIGDGINITTPEIACAGQRIQIGLAPQIGATYQWLTEGVSDPTVANPWVTQAGTYLLRVSAPGCSEVDTFHVQTYDLVDLWQPIAISCHDFSDGGAFFHLGSEISPDSISVAVNPSASWTLDSLQTIHISGLAAGAYHVSFSGYGCSLEYDFTLTNPPLPYYEKQVSPALCNDSCLGWISIHYNLSDIHETQPLDTLLSPLCEGTYITHLTSAGCPLTDTTVISRNHDLDNFQAWADSYNIYLGESVLLHSTEIDGATYRWSPPTDLDTPTEASTAATPTDTLSCYVVEVTSPQGCKASDTVCISCSVIHCGDPDYHIPNAFTPNNDGINDVVDFSSPLLSEIHVAIFNRWGECVYESSDLTNCRWDGIYKNTPCLPGVYTYTCRIRCHNNIESELKGNITLIR